MKRIKRRANAVMVIALALVVGLVVYIVRYAEDGKLWAASPINRSVYTAGELTNGSLTDRNGLVLFNAENGKISYAEDAGIRAACLHLVGDRHKNIGTGIIAARADRLVGYSPITGVYDPSGQGVVTALTIDAQLCLTAKEALGYRAGAVLVADYKTGELLCMVSSPTYDPDAGFDPANSYFEGVYLNRCLSSAYTPGSVFKLVTLSAAIENIEDLYEREFWCPGGVMVQGVYVKCNGVHGSQTVEQAFANSCNCAFAEISLALGPEALAEYAEKLGLLSPHSLSGIKTAAGGFDRAEAGSSDLAWSGIGQYTDLLSPYAMLRLVSAVANGGTVTEPKLFSDENSENTALLSAKTASAIADMMSYNVAYSYGAWNFPNLAICAKSGTAEVDTGASHSWFVGYLSDEEHPYAFVVIVEHGGSGLSGAGSVANTVLQAAVSE